MGVFHFFCAVFCEILRDVAGPVLHFRTNLSFVLDFLFRDVPVVSSSAIAPFVLLGPVSQLLVV